jgi:hypothetical protein
MPTYTVHVYREMRVTFTGLHASSPEEAASVAADLRTYSAEDVQDCEGENLSALVEVERRARPRRHADVSDSKTIYFEAGRMVDTGPTMLKALEALLTNIEEDVPLESVTRHFRDAMDAARTAVAEAKGAVS